MDSKMEDTNSKIHEVTSFVTRLRMSESLKSAGDHLDWNTLKYTPQKLKQKAKLGSYLVDEVFDDLEIQLFQIEKSFRKLLNSTALYKDQVFEICQLMNKVSEAAKSLFDPYAGLSRNVFMELNTKNQINILGDLDSISQISISTPEKKLFSNECKKWENVKIYQKVSTIILATIKDELELLALSVAGRIEKVLSLIQSIKKRIKNRSMVKYEYDKLYNKHESLMLKQKQSEMSVRQSNQLYHLERKVEDQKKEYDYVNENLKKELPYFFKLVTSFLEPLYLLIYYVQLMVDYQVSSNLLCLKDGFNITTDITSKDFLNHVAKRYTQETVEVITKLDEMFITNFRKQYFDSLTSGNELIVSSSSSKYCIAQFSFQASQTGDLTIKTGDIIKITDDSSTWWKGELEGKVGFFPSNYVVTTDAKELQS